MFGGHIIFRVNLCNKGSTIVQLDLKPVAAAVNRLKKNHIGGD